MKSGLPLLTVLAILASTQGVHAEELSEPDVSVDALELPAIELPIDAPPTPTFERLWVQTSSEIRDLLYLKRGEPIQQYCGGIRIPKRPSFPQRLGNARQLLVEKFGGSPQTEEAVLRGLKWLAKQQQEDGHWSGSQKSDVAVTSLCVLAFLGAGQTETYGRYKRQVEGAVQWLSKQQRKDGSICIPGESGDIGYSHALAGAALCEAHAMLPYRPRNSCVERALIFTVDKFQEVNPGDPDAKLGWHYKADAPADLAISSLCFMQLKTAKLAQMWVTPATFDGMIAFLDSLQKPQKQADGQRLHRYGFADNKALDYRATAAACTCRIFLGWKPDDLKGGISYFLKEGGLPEWDEKGSKVDLFYWYWGSQACFQAGGDTWKNWNEALKTALVPKQIKEGADAGSWDPVGPNSEIWGRAGQTALCVLCLETYYRYLRQNDK